jgi:hypothetical protein
MIGRLLKISYTLDPGVGEQLRARTQLPDTALNLTTEDTDNFGEILTRDMHMVWT